MSSRGAA